MPSLEEDSEAMLAPLDARAKGSAAMISLSDAELSAVMDAAKPLRPGDRDPFLRAAGAGAWAREPARTGCRSPHRQKLAVLLFRSANFDGASKYD